MSTQTNHSSPYITCHSPARHTNMCACSTQYRHRYSAPSSPLPPPTSPSSQSQQPDQKDCKNSQTRAHSTTEWYCIVGAKKNHQAGHGSCDPTKSRDHAPYGPSYPSLKVETHPQNCRPAIWNLNLKTFAWREPRALECEAPSQPTP